MVVKALGITIAMFLIKAKTQKRRFGRQKGQPWSTRWHVRSANSASTHHWPSSRDVWVWACNIWLLQCLATAWTWWCISANKGFPNLATVIKFSPPAEQNDDLGFCKSLNIVLPMTVRSVATFRGSLIPLAWVNCTVLIRMASHLLQRRIPRWILLCFESVCQNSYRFWRRLHRVFCVGHCIHLPLMLFAQASSG